MSTNVDQKVEDIDSTIAALVGDLIQTVCANIPSDEILDDKPSAVFALVDREDVVQEEFGNVAKDSEDTTSDVSALFENVNKNANALPGDGDSKLVPGKSQPDVPVNFVNKDVTGERRSDRAFQLGYIPEVSTSNSNKYQMCFSA